MTPEQAAELRKPFPPNAIGKLPKGGVQLDYVGHAATTDRLLSVDPEWTWEPVAFDEQGLPAIQGRNLWIRLTVCGVTRYGVGDGASLKEAIGDAIRNAAMRFGVALDLWSKEELEQAHGPAQHDMAPAAPDQTTAPPPRPATRTMSRRKPPEPTEPPEPEPDPGTLPTLEPMTDKQRSMLMPLFIQAGIRTQTNRHDYAQNIIGRPIQSSNELTKDEASKVIDALLQDVQELPPQDEEPPY